MSEFKKIRLTKKSLLAFLDEQLAITKNPTILTDTAERALAEQLMEREWSELKKKLLEEKKPKKTRKHQRSKLRIKYGLKKPVRAQYRAARYNLLEHIKRTFDL